MRVPTSERRVSSIAHTQPVAKLGTPLRRTQHPEPAEHKRDSLVIVPTYNEIDNLERLVKAVVRRGSFDLLVVDDNSPDGTGNLADALAEEYPQRVTVLHRDAKRGLGSAYVEGFRYALAHEYQRIFEMDADFSHDPASLLALRSALEDADVVLGSRYVLGGATLGCPLWRRVLSHAGSWYARVVLGLPFHDLTGGFKGFRSSVLSTLDLDAIQSNGYAFQIEVTYDSYVRGFRVVEEPILFADRRVGRSKMNWHIVSEAVMVVWRLRFDSGRGLHARRVTT
jgi:dolichol-phosphate mannosyltransferase